MKRQEKPTDLRSLAQTRHPHFCCVLWSEQASDWSGCEGRETDHSPTTTTLRKELQCYHKDLKTGSPKVLVAVCNLVLVTSEGSGSTPTAPPVCPEGKKQGEEGC